MTALVTLLAVVVGLLALLVVSLLRSHAEILRRLHELGMGPDGPAPAASARTAPHAGAGVASAPARPAHDLAGESPAGEALAVSVVGGRHQTLVAFLSSGCSTCAGFWDAFAGPGLGLPPATALVVVTRAADAESPATVARLAPADHTVCMSSAAWEDYDVPGSPYFVLVDGPSGRIVGEGTADTWPQVRDLMGRATDDGAHARGRPSPQDLSGQGPSGQGDQDRRDRVDAELLAAGVGPGHPSLFPDRAGARTDGDGPAGDHEAPGT